MADLTVKGARNLDVRVTGLDKVIDLLQLLERSADVVGRTRARIVTDVPYAHWVEEGFYRSGRPGRRKAGPAGMMRAGLERVQELIKPAVAGSLEKGPQAVQRSIAGVLGEGTKATKAKTPVRSGNLRASFHTVGLNQ